MECESKDNISTFISYFKCGFKYVHVLNKLNTTFGQFTSMYESLINQLSPNGLLWILSRTGRSPAQSASMVFVRQKGRRVTSPSLPRLPPPFCSLPFSRLPLLVLTPASSSASLSQVVVLVSLASPFSFQICIFQRSPSPGTQIPILVHISNLMEIREVFSRDGEGNQSCYVTESVSAWRWLRRQGLGKVVRRMVPPIRLAKYHSLPSHVNLKTEHIISTKQMEKRKVKVRYLFYCRYEFAARISFLSFEVRLIWLRSQPPEVVSTFSWVGGNLSLAHGS